MPEVVEVGLHDTTTPGTDSTERVLFDSTLDLPGGSLSAYDVNRYQLNIDNDQACTIKGYFSKDKGVTWVQFYSSARVAYSTTADPQPYDFAVDCYKDVKVTATNGGTAQGTWILTQHLICGGYHGSNT